MRNLVDFGFLTGITIVTALAADFVLAPALMALRYRSLLRPGSSRSTGRIQVRKAVSVLIACMFLSISAALAADDRALEIMRQVDAVDDGDNRTARMSMTLIDRDGSTRTRQLQTFLKDRGRDTLNLMFFLSPANVRNTGFLTHDFRDPDRDDDQWLYLPELRKTKRIAGSSKSQSFMGTDFSFADMTRRVTEEWNYTPSG